MSRTAIIRAITGLLLTAAIGWCLGGCGPIHPPKPGPPPKPVVRIAIMPRYSPYTQSQRYRPLVEYLREETGYDIRPRSAVGYRGFLSAVENTDADFALVNPVAYIILRKTRDAYPLAIALEPDFTGGPARAKNRGVILARADSGITSIADLKGKVIATGSEMAVAGYLAPKALCLQHGLDIDKEATVAVCPSQEDVIKRLRQGRAAAGFVREAIWQEAAGSSLLNSDIVPIAYSRMYPGWSVCAVGDVDKGIAETVKRALLALDWDDVAHKEVLLETGLRGFVETSDEEYNVVRALLTNIRMPY